LLACLLACLLIYILALTTNLNTIQNDIHGSKTLTLVNKFNEIKTPRI
jgi:hypothetical protein